MTVSLTNKALTGSFAEAKEFCIWRRSVGVFQALIPTGGKEIKLSSLVLTIVSYGVGST
jgi:hypothetical protein